MALDIWFSSAQNPISAQTISSDSERTAPIPPDDESTTTAMLHQGKFEKLIKHPEIGPIFKATSFKGNSDWLTSNARYVSASHYELSIIARLGVAHPKLPKNLQCPGCQLIFDSKDIITHIPGCVRCTGLNASSKHNAMVRFLYDLCM